MSERDIEVHIKINNIQNKERHWAFYLFPEHSQMEQVTDEEMNQILSALEWTYKGIKSNYLRACKKYHRNVLKEIDQITEAKDVEQIQGKNES